MRRLSASQKRGALVLLVILIFVAGWRFRANWLAEHGEQSEPNAENNSAASAPAKPEVMVELNSADTTALQSVRGIGAVYAKRIVRYRQLIGGYKDPEQLMQVYGISPEAYLRIEPQVYVDTTGPAFAELRDRRIARNAEFRAELPPRRKWKYQRKPYEKDGKVSHSDDQAPVDEQRGDHFPKKESTHIVNINTADSTELTTVSGIGPKTARTILKYRKLIFFFRSLDQLSEVWGIRPENLERMKPQLTVGEDLSAFPRLLINESDAYTLSRHKYLSYKEAKMIVAYRDMHGAFGSQEDLRKMHGVKAETWDLLEAYIAF